MKRLIVSTAVILATLGGLLLLWQFRIALVLFVLSLAVTAMARPAMDYGVSRGLPRGLAITLTYSASLIFIGGLLFLISGPFLTEIQGGSNNLSSVYEQVVLFWPKGSPFQQAIARELPPPDQLYQAISGERGMTLLYTILGVAQDFFTLLGQIAIVLVLSIYWSAGRVQFERLWLSFLPAQSRARAQEIWREIESGVGAYLRSELIQSLLAGILLGSGYWLMGVHYPVVLAVSGAVLWLIPWLGAVLAVILPIIIGLGFSPLLAVMAAVYTLGVLLFLEVVVEPRIFNRRRYSSLLVILYVVALADAFGLIGLLIAPPMAAATQILFRDLMQLSSPAETVKPWVQLERLRSHLEELQTTVESTEEPPSPEITNLIERLRNLISEADSYLKASEEEGRALGLPVSTETPS